MAGPRAEVSQPGQHPQSIHAHFRLLQTRQARLRCLYSEAHLGQPAPPGPTQAHLPAHRQHVIKLSERRLPAVPELKAEHDNTVAGLQLGRPKYHGGLDAWGGGGRSLSMGEAEVERSRGPRRNRKRRYVPTLMGPQSDGEGIVPDVGEFSVRLGKLPCPGGASSLPGRGSPSPSHDQVVSSCALGKPNVPEYSQILQHDGQSASGGRKQERKIGVF